MAQATNRSPRVVALVGPYQSGKTTLLENILFYTDTTRRRANGERVFGDDSAEAKALSMGVEVNIASCRYLGDEYMFLDCPGSVEFAQEANNALFGVDVAVVVAEPEPAKIQALSPLLHELEAAKIPHILFINKIDHSEVHIREMAAAIDAISAVPAVLRHIPIREEGSISGFVDLAAKRAYHYKNGGESERIDMPENLADQIAGDRFQMLETLADFHDELMEELLEDIEPASSEVFQDLAEDLSAGRIMPVMMGSADQMFGIRRLLKALRHEVCGIGEAVGRLNPSKTDDPVFYILKNRHLPHVGKMTFARIASGTVVEGQELRGEKISGLMKIQGTEFQKCRSARAGDVVAIPRLNGGEGGSFFGGKTRKGADKLAPVYSVALSVEDRKDEARLSEALSKLVEEDPSYEVIHCVDTGQLQLWGQGEIHLRAAKIKLTQKYGVNVSFTEMSVPYKETIRKTITQHTRYKKQSGGHGQFGDVVIEVKPRPIGTGFYFSDHVTGGAIPKQYIPSVEAGVKEYLQQGPLGFPVVDVAVTLQDGKHHSVDSSDMAFKTAGRKAMAEALPDCEPVLLEPIEEVHVVAPSDYIAKINGLIMSRRGQIMGYNNRKGWPGWDQIDAQIPMAEVKDMILELRSVTQGTGTFSHRFDHLTELSGRHREQVLKSRSPTM